MVLGVDSQAPTFLPVEPAAAKLGIPVKFLREQVRDQQIPHIVIGRRVLIPAADASRVLKGNPLELSRSLVDTPRGFNSRVALGVVFAAPPFADDRAIYVGLAASVTLFETIFQTRFLPFRFRVLRLNFLGETASM